MLKNKLRAIVPIAALVAVAACADTTGPTSPTFGTAQAESTVEEQQDQLPKTQTKNTRPLEQEREHR